MTPPLEGIRVLDLTRLLPGGYATLLLAGLGADVVKVEQPGRGDYIRWTPPMAGEHSAAHLALNRNKRSITLNLKSERARAVFVALAAGFDVVVESFRPGVLDRLGVGWSVLSEHQPRLVYCAITGYGQDGPRAYEAGHDINYMAHAGALGLTGPEDGAPVVPALQIGDLAGGGMQGVIAILAALHRRASTGTGGFCDVAMLDGVVSWLAIHVAASVASGREPERGRMPLSGGFPCYRIYPAADGYLAVGALEPQFWTALCTAIDRSDLAGDAYAVGARRTEVIAQLEELFGGRSRAEWMEAFAGLDVCVAPVNGLTEALADPQVRHRNMAVEKMLDGTPWVELGNPIRLQGAGPLRPEAPAPGLGEHTAEVLAEIGLDEAAVAGLRAEGAV